ncbi:hypothetical protein ACE6H2_021307 [Prunus campanulata]
MRVKNREPCPDCHVGSMIAKCRTIMTWTPFSLEKLRNVSIKWRFTTLNGVLTLSSREEVRRKRLKVESFNGVPCCVHHPLCTSLNFTLLRKRKFVNEKSLVFILELAETILENLGFESRSGKMLQEQVFFVNLFSQLPVMLTVILGYD